ncbi:hypothetical protein AVEN_16626-1 [Araneus ventricosus]|uniref:Uncharacterized protein n=1 Tax=Araneus ventricosus TaxID=182803 RepID=A0A4Y2I4V7_ARAVE|nr:hypothetical protein AVEN_16626-1 [Araneus ventricosus]
MVQHSDILNSKHSTSKRQLNRPYNLGYSRIYCRKNRKNENNLNGNNADQNIDLKLPGTERAAWAPDRFGCPGSGRNCNSAAVMDEPPLVPSESQLKLTLRKKTMRSRTTDERRNSFSYAS